jgi:hypothetical protein
MVANRLLLRYLEEKLAFPVPNIGAQSTNTPEQIEKQLEERLFSKRGIAERFKDWIDRNTYKEAV